MTARNKTPPARVLVADPAWTHRDKLGKRGAAAKYQTMSTSAICKMPLPSLAKERVLFLWKLANMTRDALAVCKAWGFVDVAELVWQKLRPCQTCCATGRVDLHRIDTVEPPLEVLVPGTDCVCPACRGHGGEVLLDDDLGVAVPSAFGMGTTVRNVHETCIIARPISGRAPERLDLGVRSSFSAPMLIDIDGELPESNGRKGALVHSAKPDAFFAIVERLYPGPYVEMFSRSTREGWTGTGNEPSRLDAVREKMRVTWPRRVAKERIEQLRAKADRRRR